MKILFLAPFPPRQDAPHGGGRCVNRLLRTLSTRHQTGLIYFREHGEEPLDRQVREQCEFAIEVPRRNGVGTRVRALGGLFSGRPVWATLLQADDFRRQVVGALDRWRPDVVQAEFLVMGQYLDTPHECVSVLRVHDTGVSVARERMAASGGLRRLQRRLDLRAWERFEPQVCGWADATVVFTARDAKELAAGPGARRITIVPPDVEFPPRTLDPLGQGSPEVLFLGNFSHSPNIEAALRLTRAIFPEVRRSLPAAVLRIVGPFPPQEIAQHPEAGVTVMGKVDSVEPWLDRAAVVAAPLASGGGIRVKVMEALAAGKAVVASPRALEGIDAIPGREVVVAETDAEFSAAIVRLLRDPEERRSVALGGRRWAERKASISQSDAFDGLYRELLASRQKPAPVGELAR